MRYLAPAKINLYLKVMGKRPDGYHQIETVMQTVSLYDILTIEPFSRGIKFFCDNSALEKDNLILRAVKLLEKFNRKRKGAKIILKKNIPIGGGLGGGSSDAACVLKALNRLWELNLSENLLFSLAKKVGADVPFFLRGGYAYAFGIGEKVYPYPSSPNYWVVLVNPGFPVFSKEVYSDYDRLHLTRKRNFNKIKNCKVFWGNFCTSKGIAKNLFNHLEEVVFRRYPEIRRIKETLISFGAEGALMSGSGATAFGLVESEKKGKRILEELKKYPWQNWLVRTTAGEQVSACPDLVGGVGG